MQQIVPLCYTCYTCYTCYMLDTLLKVFAGLLGNCYDCSTPIQFSIQCVREVGVRLSKLRLHLSTPTIRRSSPILRPTVELSTRPSFHLAPSLDACWTVDQRGSCLFSPLTISMVLAGSTPMAPMQVVLAIISCRPASDCRLPWSTFAGRLGT